jgi:hypothetical protein
MSLRPRGTTTSDGEPRRQREGKESARSHARTVHDVPRFVWALLVPAPGRRHGVESMRDALEERREETLTHE